MKTCTKCKVDKDESLFYRDNRRAGGLLAKCKECADAYAKRPDVAERRRAARNNPEGRQFQRWKKHSKTPEFLAKKKHWERAHRYGLTVEMFEKLLTEQEGKCAICKKELVLDGGKVGMHTDHDHKTSKVRGLLCAKCNRGLGCFDDNPGFLTEAIKYLERK